jgi:hypothetical protein
VACCDLLGVKVDEIVSQADEVLGSARWSLESIEADLPIERIVRRGVRPGSEPTRRSSFKQSCQTAAPSLPGLRMSAIYPMPRSLS